MKNDSEMSEQLEGYLSSIKNGTSRNTNRADAGKKAFLELAADYASDQKKSIETRPSGKTLFGKSNFGWFSIRRLTFSVLITGLVVALMGGTTVFASQYSLPNQSLYPVKLWSENAGLEIASGDQSKFEMMLTITDRRVSEIGSLMDQGITIDEESILRLEHQQRQTMMFAMNMPEVQATSALNRIRSQTVGQERQVTQAGVGFEAGSAVKARIRLMMQNQIHAVDLGLVDLPQLRYQYGNQNGSNSNGNQQFPALTSQPSNTGSGIPFYGTPSPMNGQGSGSCTTCATTGTPIGNQYQSGNPDQSGQFGQGGGNGQTSGGGSGSKP